MCRSYLDRGVALNIQMSFLAERSVGHVDADDEHGCHSIVGGLNITEKMLALISVLATDALVPTNTRCGSGLVDRLAIKRIVHRWPFLSLFFPLFFLPFLKYFILFFFSSYFFSPSSVFSLLCDSACLALEIDRICLISLSRVMSLNDRKYCMLFGDSFLQFSPTRNSCHLHGWNVL